MNKETFNITKAELGNLIKEYRERKGITIRKACKLINVETSDMEAIEGGFALGKLISKQTGKPTTLFYTLAGLYALDTMEIFSLKSYLCAMFHFAPPSKNGPGGKDEFSTNELDCVNK